MTLTHAVTTTPADLVAALSLAAATSYVVEVVIGNPAVRMFEGGDSAPTDRSYFHVTQPGAAGRIGITPASGKKVWVWSTGASRLVVTEQE